MRSDGLQSVALQNAGCGGNDDVCLFKANRNGIQILHNGRSHWICIRTTGTLTVELYDSADLVITDHLKSRIAILMGCDRGSIVVQKMGVQMQDYNDCGVLAIAFAWTLANNRRPENLTFDLSKLRAHLLHCLLGGKFSDFPLTGLQLPGVKPCCIHLALS